MRSWVALWGGELWTMAVLTMPLGQPQLAQPFDLVRHGPLLGLRRLRLRRLRLRLRRRRLCQPHAAAYAGGSAVHRASALLDEPAAAEDGVERGAARGVEAQAAVEQRDGGGRELRRRWRARSGLVRGLGLGVRVRVRLRVSRVRVRVRVRVRRSSYLPLSP